MMNISKIKINYLTYFAILLFLFSGYKNNVISIFIIFVIHEIGHIFFCFLFGVKIIKLEVFPFGGIIKIDNLINYPIFKSLLISSGGIIFQLIFEIINLLFIKSKMISSYNYMILMMNIIPIIPLDGSKIVQLIFSYFISFYKSLLLIYFISFLLVLFIFFNANNPLFIVFSLTFLIKEIMNLSYLFNRFLLERYMYDFKFKKSKYYPCNDLKKLSINKYGFFFENTWKNEKEILHKKFDNCSYIW